MLFKMKSNKKINLKYCFKIYKQQASKLQLRENFMGKK